MSHPPLRLDDPLLAQRLLGRGVWRLPFLHDGRPVLAAISAAGEVLALRRVPAEWTMRAACAALTAWLERRDPAPRLQLVGQQFADAPVAPPAAAAQAGEPRAVALSRVVGPLDVSPYEERPPRRSATWRRRRHELTRPTDAASPAAWAMWRADQVRRSGTYQLPRRPA